MVPVVDLDREFSLIFPTLPSPSGLFRPADRAFTWDTLLLRPRVIVLAEALSGKTTEFERRTELLNQAGRVAFFLRIQVLADEGLRAAFSPVEMERWERWLAGNDDAWFFLDARDEVHLTYTSFESSLRRLARELGGHIQRAHIVISSRASDWRGEEDLAALERLLPSPADVPVENETERLLTPVRNPRHPLDTGDSHASRVLKPSETIVVQLLPLYDQQCRELAAAAGVGDVDAFMQAIDRNGLENFASRPGDLLQLAGYWRTYTRFDRAATMLEEFIRASLRESDSSRWPDESHTLQRAYAGARRIAAALTMGQSFTLYAPRASGARLDRADALDVRDVLDDWNDREWNALLRRGIFAPATYGRIRFHHRSTQDFLTARWLEMLLKEGCPVREIHNILFRQTGSTTTIARSLRPVAAWLSLWNADIRDEMIARFPEILLSEGDPGSLPLEAKQRLLLRTAERDLEHRYGTRTLQLLAEPALAGTIREAWSTSTSPQFREALLKIIAAGSMRECADLAAELASDSSAPTDARCTALTTLVQLDDREALATFVAGLKRDTGSIKPTSYEIPFRAFVVEHLFPRYLSVDDVLVLIRHSLAAAEPFFNPALKYAWESCPNEADRLCMASALADLCADVVLNHSERSKLLAEYVERIVDRASAVLDAASLAEKATLLTRLRDAHARPVDPPRQRPFHDYFSPSGEKIYFKADSTGSPPAHGQCAEGDDETAVWLEARDTLQKNPDVLIASDSQDPDAATMLLMVLSKWLELRTGLDVVGAALRHQLLDEAFGQGVSDKYRDAMCRRWRTTVPQRPVVNGDRLLISVMGQLAVAGIIIEATTMPGWIDRLSDDEAERAAMHGCWSSRENDLNWLDLLVTRYPAKVLPVLQAALENEWRSPISTTLSLLSHYASRLRSAPLPIPAAVQRILYKTFVAYEPGFAHLQLFATAILMRMQPIAAELQQIEAAIYARNTPRESLGMLFIASPGRAIDQLMRFVDQESAQSREALVAEMFYVMFDEFYYPARRRADRASLVDLERLACIAFQYVPPQDDVNHMNYTRPGQRMPAQQAREAILDALFVKVAQQGPVAFGTFLYRPDLPQALKRAVRERLARQAQEDVDAPAWTPAEVLDFERRHLGPLKTGGDLLLAVVGVVADIERDLLDADSSSRKLLQLAPDEATVHEWIAGQLRIRSGGRLRPHREEKVAEDKRPDLVITALGTSAELAIEIKHLGKEWSGNDLEKALVEQLAGCYLRPEHRRHGILLLTHHHRTRTWHSSAGEVLDFEALVASLQSIADVVTDCSDPAIGLRVIGLRIVGLGVADEDG